MLDAIQFQGNLDEVEAFVGGDAEYRDGKLLVATTHGPLWASPGQWIMRVYDGSFVVMSVLEV